MKVSFIGLGIMGSRMASHLIESVDLVVSNRTASAADGLVAQGASFIADPAIAVQEADIVITMLSTPDVVKSIANGKNGFLARMKEGALWIDCTTVDPAFSKAMAVEAEQYGIQFLEAPVSGTKPHAEKGELVFFVGGDENILQKVSPLLEKMGRKTVHAGGHGTGSSLKILVNALLAHSMLAFSEVLVLGEKMGMDKSFLLDFLPQLPVTAPVIKFKTENLNRREYPTQFPLEWMQKDLQLLSQTAYEYDVPLTLGNVAKSIYAQAKNAGLAREDFSAVYEYLAD